MQLQMLILAVYIILIMSCFHIFNYLKYNLNYKKEYYELTANFCLQFDRFLICLSFTLNISILLQQKRLQNVVHIEDV